MDESAAPVKGPRFPWPVALLCAASLGVAAWTWMRYSYAWDVPIGLIRPRPKALKSSPWYGRYVVARVVPLRTTGMGSQWKMRFSSETSLLVEHLCLIAGTAKTSQNCVFLARPASEAMVAGRAVAMRGRVGTRADVLGRTPMEWVDDLVIDTTASRFTWQSITGLVVGAMGVVVFAVYLRTWLRERKAAA